MAQPNKHMRLRQTNSPRIMRGSSCGDPIRDHVVRFTPSSNNKGGGGFGYLFEALKLSFSALVNAS